MAKDKKTPEKKTELEREYIIPLRKEWRKVANYRRTGRAIKEIKKFIAKHMKVPDRDVSKVKLDLYLNQEVWFRGRKKPPAKIKVRAKKEEGIVKVELAELPDHWKFTKSKHERKHKEAPKPAPTETKPTETSTTPSEGEKKDKEDTPEVKEEKKKEEKEKSISAAERQAKMTETQAKAQTKATSKSKQMPIQRKALKK